MNLSLQDIEAAASRIKPHINKSPILTSTTLDHRMGDRNIFFKAEMMQRTGSFKMRGATNAVLCHPEATSFVAHSSGNHGAALAHASCLQNKPCHIVFPEGGNPIKRAAMERYEAILYPCANTHLERERIAAEVMTMHSSTFVHPSENHHVICGQGTVALEMINEIDDLEAIVVPVGGGGIISGTCLAVPASMKVYGAEPRENGDALQSLTSGTLHRHDQATTICDGLRSPIGPQTFSLMKNRVDDILAISDEETLFWMRYAMQVLKVLIEPSSAIAIAAAAMTKEKKIGVILTGGNLDLANLPWKSQSAVAL
jgi:threonine dehydratase